MSAVGMSHSSREGVSVLSQGKSRLTDVEMPDPMRQRELGTMHEPL